MFLLDFDSEFANYDGRAVVALGNPDTADRTGVVVPGITNDLGNFGSTLEKAANLRHAVHREYGLAAKTATVAWLGYDTPQSLIDGMDRREAKDGARRLQSFLDSMGAARAAAGQKAGSITVFGHSYGSSTSALAVARGMKVDNLALVGSPLGRW
ncbi:hypothetical protein BH23ACT12_BH23ACT12_15910 [soil metagenome]